MRSALWALLILAVTFLDGWIVLGPWRPQNTAMLVLIFLSFSLPNFGAFWMMYTVARNEKRPFRFFVFSLLPYAFLWYYFERVKTGKYNSREPR
jgi:hypothetical protein